MQAIDYSRIDTKTATIAAADGTTMRYELAKAIMHGGKWRGVYAKPRTVLTGWIRVYSPDGTRSSSQPGWAEALAVADEFARVAKLHVPSLEEMLTAELDAILALETAGGKDWDYSCVRVAMQAAKPDWNVPAGMRLLEAYYDGLRAAASNDGADCDGCGCDCGGKASQ